MFHLSVFDYTSGATAAKTLVDAPAVSDPAVTLNANGHVVFEEGVDLLLAYGFGQTDLTAVQFTTPKLRPIAPIDIFPFDITTVPSTRTPVCNYLDSPVALNKIDENSMQISASTGTSGNLWYAAAWFGNKQYGRSQGPIYTVQFTAAVTAVTNAWTNGTISLSTTLPAGQYAVVGLHVFGTNLAFARLIFPNQQWRPGCIGGQVAGTIPNPCFRHGKLGDYGKFMTYSPPQLDIFCIGACTAQTGLIDIVRIGPLIA